MDAYFRKKLRFNNQQKDIGIKGHTIRPTSSYFYKKKRL